MIRFVERLLAAIKRTIIVITFLCIIPSMVYSVYYIVRFDFFRALIGLISLYVAIDVNLKVEV